MKKSTNQKYENQFWWMLKICFGETPYKKYQKIKNVKKLTLMNAWKIFLRELFLLKEYIYLAQKLRALLSNKNGILHDWKSQ